MSGWLGVRGEMAGVPGVTAGFWGGVRWSGLALGAAGAASLRGFWLVGGEGNSMG